MKNLMYECRVVGGRTDTIAVYRADSGKRLDMVLDNLHSVDDSDLRLLYLEEGYENFYNEKEHLSHENKSFRTMYGTAKHTMYDCNGMTEVITGSGRIRLSPFIQSGMVTVSGDVWIDFRGALKRDVMLYSDENDAVHDVYVTDVTYGSVLVLSMFLDKVTVSPVHISTSILGSLAKFWSSNYVPVHIEELDAGLSCELDDNMEIAHIHVTNSGVMDMMKFRPSRHMQTLTLDCGGYENAAEWLFMCEDLLGCLDIEDMNGSFLSFLDEMDGVVTASDYSTEDEWVYAIRLPDTVHKREYSMDYKVHVAGRSRKIGVTCRKFGERTYVYLCLLE